MRLLLTLESVAFLRNVTVAYYVVQAYNENTEVTDKRESGLLGYSF